jgi:hypothetical protein
MALLSAERHAARAACSLVAGKHHDPIVSRVDEGQRPKLEVLVGVANRGEALRSASRSRLDRVVGIHVFNVVGEVAPGRLLPPPGLVDAADEFDVHRCSIRAVTSDALRERLGAIAAAVSAALG